MKQEDTVVYVVDDDASLRGAIDKIGVLRIPHDSHDFPTSHCRTSVYGAKMSSERVLVAKSLVAIF